MPSKVRKIAFVSNTSWSLYNFRLQIFQDLQSLGYKILLIAPKDEFTAKLVENGFDFKPIRLDNYGINPIRDFRLYQQLSKIYKSEKPDLIYHYTIKPNIYGSFAARINRIPSILITTGLGHLFDFKNRIVSLIAKTLYRVSSNLSKEVWFLNKEDRQIFLSRKVIPKTKAKLLNSEGIDLTHFKSTENRSNNGKKFLFAGRLLKDKGIQYFIKVAESLKNEHPELEFNVLGFINENNPNSIKYSELLDAQRKGFIKYLGETTDVRPFIEKTDCLIFPSYYKEGASRILMEAAALETPIITTNNVGCKDIVDDGVNGFLIPVKDTIALKNAILNFIKLSDEERNRMGMAGRNKMNSDFNIELIKAEYRQNAQKYLS